ncbi:hypothetical protein EXIGLDRAFT_837648 [Exidia glandulosa HHB12029]|uniref:Uncharacterized protein n=1 Tax=Exidia glandulosa HHB12029 TaxID=1314781 RepID=A0A165GK46_EXIGL|nr:hypothetical protein EXIGLDRAFT_837648 [Exidia glandulosa HHB12029]
MFGEFDSSDNEGPSVGSPWDSLLSSSPSPETEDKKKLQRSSRLTPEVEEGNVEYKLKLIDPTPERFARLVTQLKWRLLEGSGQAYYELGVADSGQLVGLPRVDLDRTLETLEAMAGEIGASVIIVKEIEVPALRTLKEGLLGVPVGGGVDFSQVDGAMRLPRRKHLLLPPSDDSEGDTETPETDPTTDEALTADEQPAHWLAKVHVRDADRFDWSVRVDDDELFDIEVSSVYKPLPSLRRAQTEPTDIPSRRLKTKRERDPRTQTQNQPAPRPRTKQQEQDARAVALERKLRRDARRDERRRAIMGGVSEASVFDMSDIGASLPEEKSAVLKKTKASAADENDGGPRLIVEALVVRKSANDDVFACLNDFGAAGFIV